MRHAWAIALSICVLAACGCGRSDQNASSASPPGAPNPTPAAPAASSASAEAAARQNFIKVSKNMGDYPLVNQILPQVDEMYAKGQGFAWSDIDRNMLGTTAETLVAYKGWRDAMIAAHSN